MIETEYKDIIELYKSRLGFNKYKSLHAQLGIKVTKNYTYPTLRGKTIKLIREFITYPDPRKCWKKSAINSIYELITKEHIDALISTSPPATAHLIANHIKQSSAIPWVADFRDLWTQNHFYEKNRVIRFLEKRLELKTLSDADAIVTVTPGFADNLKSLHKNKRIYCITNGYDKDDFAEVAPKLTSKFTITYTGTLYGGRRDPSLLFKVLQELINENKLKKDLIDIRFLGDKEEWILDAIKNYNLNGLVNFYGVLSRKSTLEAQKESQLLLLLLDSNNKEKNVYPAKVFEYFGAKRPIIAYGGNEGAVHGLLKNTNAGKFAMNVSELKNILLNYYDEFIESGEVKSQSNNNIINFEYEFIANQYSKILNGVAVKL